MHIRLWAPYYTWSLGRYCESAFRQLGHTVTVSDFRARPLSDIDLPGDLIFVIKGSPEIVPFLKRAGVQKALWFPDDPHGGSLPRSMAPYFDYVFTAHKPQIPYYKKLGVNVFWLPFACDPAVHRPFPLDKRHDFVFIGTVDPHRKRFFDKLGNNFSVSAGSGVFLEDMSRTYCTGRIGINISKSGEITMRVFEIMACGVLLFTDSVNNNISELLAPGEHFIHYTQSKLVTLGRKYLADGVLSAKVAKEGCRVVRGRHTYKHRMQEVLRVCFG